MGTGPWGGTMKPVTTGVLLALLAMSCACGYSSKNYGMTAMPAIAQLNPDSANAGGAAFTLTVNGSNFAAHAVINWNGAAVATTFVNGGQLTATIPATSISASGTVPITVTNPATTGGGGIYGGGGGTPAMTSSPENFTVN